MFQDRLSAGRQLADQMQSEDVSLDLVLGVPRGGLPAAWAVADAYDVPLDVVAAKKLGAPNNPELAIGAAAADGTVWLNDDIIDRLRVGDDYIESEREQAMSVAAEKERTYREGREPPTIDGKHVAIVDDGVATGATAKASIRAVRNQGAQSVILGVPVGPPDTVTELREEADRVVVVEQPSGFGAIGAHYRDFGQVSDEEAMEYLRS
ncbi:phosphoribosyltransferase [Halanaeroarchaeum sulfurireducens]|uniref:Phosphoribosyltransferase n=1 Tax=Halanaeroarchaeum sulfurireducens TaxID=1604004 RepID=A0A0F7PD75_9EURY|nr:phosphoribosyltransferase family protein [Halanaeroarchaeum sulfurireducens]AKH98135.1 phosphoribosyltransferase [Halanaeroarchaeum sulfurireducens]ALG82529.1 phosphoribosyltransferase [Halanaeroarchaeum sulfurireducens]